MVMSDMHKNEWEGYWLITKKYLVMMEMTIIECLQACRCNVIIADRSVVYGAEVETIITEWGAPKILYMNTY